MTKSELIKKLSIKFPNLKEREVESILNLVLKEVPTQKAWNDVKEAYEELYPGYTLMDDLDGDGFDKEYVESIINKKPIA